MNDNNTLKRNTLLLTMATIINKGLQFLGIPFFSHWLTVGEYGQFDLLCTYISLLIPIISLSTHEAVFRFNLEENNKNKRKANITNCFVIYSINLCIFLIASLFIFNRLPLTVYVCFIFYLVTELHSTYLKGYLRSIKRIDIYSFSMVLTTILMILLVTVFVWIFKWGLAGILLGYAIGTLMGNILLCIWGKWASMLCFRKCSISNMWALVRYALPLIPNDISWWVMNASDRQIINVFIGDVANGVYAIAHKIPALCQVIFNMFSISWQQEIVTRIDSPDANKLINEVFNTFLKVLLAVGGGLMAGSFVLYYFIFDLKYFEAIYYSPILLTSAVLIAVSQFLGGVQIALKKTFHNGISTVIGAACNVWIHMLLISGLGLFAASISTLVSNIVIVILRFFLLRNKIRIQIEKKAVLAITAYLYFFTNAYLHGVLWKDICNLLLSVIVFGLLNKKWIYEMCTK
ncbi:MAG: oligosaccharide flippase family protein [Lachnospiraceae bacterium]|jgi:O-antigen/teichoic acid export membrane protein|nr:oligosaccharide flippase family protein [Lachnospiraceae bacterium]